MIHKKPDSQREPGSGSGAYDDNLFLTDAQLAAEIAKCEYCEEKPCLEACPAHCSPADFIKAMELGLPSDVQRAAALIMGKNPLGGICGMVCPDFHCMAACVHRKLDSAVNIPMVQAAIVQRAKELDCMPQFAPVQPSGKKVAVVGGGPAGLAAAGTLARRGHAVTIYERDCELGGMCNCIPDFRLDKQVLQSDIAWTLSLGQIEVQLNHEVTSAQSILDEGTFDAVVVTTGLWSPILPGIPGEQQAITAEAFLQDPGAFDVQGRVVVIGGGATAFDCAAVAQRQGARSVEMIALETLGEMPLTGDEMEALVSSGIDVNGRRQVSAIDTEGETITGIRTCKVSLKDSTAGFSLANIAPLEGGDSLRGDVDVVIIAIGLRPAFPREAHPRVVYAGDMVEGPTTVVEASAAGKNAAAAVESVLAEQDHEVMSFKTPAGKVKSRVQLPGYNFSPVDLQSDFFGRPIPSPFLLSAAPPTDGLDQMRLAYQAGWAGGIMKTAFDGVPIHIPERYMFAFDKQTYANCDNVSGHPLQRVCREVEQLVKEYPDRLTMASTGGPVSGDDEADRAGWVSNTHKLEASGVMGIEYSLSCPQGGDGTEGDIVSQNAALTAKIIDWVMDAGDGEVPKLFKLTGAVTSVAVIVDAAREVFQRYPHKKGGITLANSFPTLAFRPGAKEGWEEGIIVGASGAGILNISYLSLAKVAHLGVHISGNGGPMDYKAAADFLALGVRTVQFCTLVTKYGYGIIDDLCAGVSHLMAHRGLSSMDQLIGAALPGPVTDFMELSPQKMISAPDREHCLQCGNCTRCPYLAISNDETGYPGTDPSRCVGCGICALKCFAQAIRMRERSSEEAAALCEE